jgi:hypothetical protein
MTDEPLPPAGDETPDTVVAAPKPERRDLLPWACGLGFLILAVAIVYLWQFPRVPPEMAADASAIPNLQQRLADIDGRLTVIEKRPPVDLGKITSRIDALEARSVDQTQLSSRMDVLSGRIESLAGRDQTSADAAKQRLDALTSRIAALESTAGTVDAVTKRTSRIAKIQVASLALGSGHPIGDLPGAPEALARYAHAAPPTEAELRLRFPRYEQAAVAAKQPDEVDAPFVDRVWDRAQSLITIRSGTDVVVGNPSAIILSHAQDALDLGDIAAAVSAVEQLKGQPAQAMAPWLADAKSLLGARSALADMANGS